MSSSLRKPRRRGLKAAALRAVPLVLAVLAGWACGGPSDDEGAGPRPWKTDRCLVFLHRGARLEAPEGTMAAVRAAFRQGADGVELDVRRSLDGVLVTYHDDDTFFRGAGFRPIEAMTIAEIRDLDLGSGFDPRFRGEKVATIEEILRYALANELYLRIDLKSKDVAADMAALLDRCDAWRLMASSVDGAFRDRECSDLPFLTEDLWMQGGEDDAAALESRIAAHEGPFRVTVDDARILSRVLGRRPAERVEVPPVAQPEPGPGTALPPPERGDPLARLERRPLDAETIWAIGRNGRSEFGEELVAIVETALSRPGRPDEGQAVQATLALGRARCPGAVELLSRCLTGPPPIALSALVALGEIGSPKAAAVLGAILVDPRVARLPQWAIVEMAIQLGRCGEAGRRALVAGLIRDEVLVRREVVFTLARLGPEAAREAREARSSGALPPSAEARVRLLESLVPAR